eukprot:471871-Prorocentrum_minimum.AAC.2
MTVRSPGTTHTFSRVKFCPATEHAPLARGYGPRCLLQDTSSTRLEGVTAWSMRPAVTHGVGCAQQVKRHEYLRFVDFRR